MSSSQTPGLRPRVGDRVQVNLLRLSRGGKAVGKTTEGFVVFVEAGAPHEIVEAEITALYPRYAEGLVAKIVSPSPSRVSPPCPVFGRCGGCSWQHVAYDEQIQQKQAILREALRRSGALRSDELDQLTVFHKSPEQYRYRSRINLQTEAGQVGFRARATHQLVPIEDCLIAKPGLVAAAKEKSIALHQMDHSLRNQKIHMALTNGGDIKVHEGFTQINLAQNQNLQLRVVEHVTQFVEAHGGFAFWRILDLYCGDGNFTFPLTERLASVASGANWRIEAVDFDRANIERANQTANSALLPRKNLHFHHRKVETWLKSDRELTVSSEQRQAGHVVILDPPRSGCERSALDELVRLSPDLFVVISCDPMTLARDIAYLRESARRQFNQEYRCLTVEGFDMFPQTDHIEALLVLSKVASKA